MRLASLLIRERGTLVYWVSLLFAPVVAGVGAAWGLDAKGWRADIAASMGVATWMMYFSAGVVASMHLHEMRRETDYRQADATAEYTAPVGFDPMYADEADNSVDNLVIVHADKGQNYFLHISKSQLRSLKRRIDKGFYRIPVNSMEGFTSTQTQALRAELLAVGLATNTGRKNSEVEITPEGIIAIRSATTTPLRKE